LKTPKKQANFRLSESTLREINELSKRYSVSAADVVTVLVHIFYTGDEDYITRVEELFTIIGRG
jgi:hypothetical protein